MSSSRRDFLRTGILLGAATLGDRLSESSPITAQAGNLYQLRTPVLDVGFEQYGDPAGQPVILLHGFPYDVRSFDGVVPGLTDQGFNVLMPYLRGYGPTRFVDSTTPRMAEQAALAQDLVDFCAAAGLDRAVIAGFDWGNRAACIAAITDPDRILGLVSIGGYSVQDTTREGPPAPAALEALLWYQWYFNTERGRAGLENNRHDIIRYLWETWSPQWSYSDADYQRSASSFDNPDFVDVVVHSYRHRHANAPGEERFLQLEQFLAGRPPIEVPTVVLRAAASGFGPPSTNPASDQRNFSNLVARHIVTGAGHDLPVQRPDAVIAAVRELLD